MLFFLQIVRTHFSSVLFVLFIFWTVSCASRSEEVLNSDKSLTVQMPEAPSDDEELTISLAKFNTIDIDSMDADTRLVYGVLLRNAGELDKAREVLEDLVNSNPAMGEAWFNLALVEHATENADKRDIALEKALHNNPSMVEALSMRGSVAVKNGDWALAEESYKNALEHNPSSVDSLMGLAWVLAKTERTEIALSLLDKAVLLAPDYVYARVDRSRVNLVLGNYNDAEKDLDVAVELEPEVAWHYLDRARIRLRYFKNYDGALADLEATERLNPGNFFALVYLAGLHDEERRFTLSQQYYQKVVAMRPDYIWAFLPLGKFAWMQGKYEEAAKWFAKAAAEEPTDFSFQLMTGLSLLKAGKTRQSSAIFADTLRLFQPGETAYEVVRFCAERNVDYYAVNALNRETNKKLRERLWFYMGAIYSLRSENSATQAVNERIMNMKGDFEFDLAWAAINGMDS